MDSIELLAGHCLSAERSVLSFKTFIVEVSYQPVHGTAGMPPEENTFSMFLRVHLFGLTKKGAAVEQICSLMQENPPYERIPVIKANGHEKNLCGIIPVHCNYSKCLAVLPFNTFHCPGSSM